MLQFGAATNLGNQRSNNEDSYVSHPDESLWIVADGMGGLGSGEVASAITSFTITSMLMDGHGINQSIELSHQRIKEYAHTSADGMNMGTTLVLLYSKGSLYNIFWVGDSRAYLFEEKLVQLTHDHSLVQNMVDQGEISKEEATTHPRKSAVTRALGVQELETVRADSISEKWKPRQKILLCSDGLTDCVADTDIERIIAGVESNQDAVDQLIEKALIEGGKDNITAILVSAPENLSDNAGDTEFPNDDTSGFEKQLSAKPELDNSDTRTMDRSPLLVQTAGVPGKVQVEPIGSAEKKKMNPPHD